MDEEIDPEMKAKQDALAAMSQHIGAPADGGAAEEDMGAEHAAQDKAEGEEGGVVPKMVYQRKNKKGGGGGGGGGMIGGGGGGGGMDMSSIMGMMG